MFRVLGVSNNEGACVVLMIDVPTGERVRVVLPDGRECWVSVVIGNSGRLKLGFDFPRDVEVGREGALGVIKPGSNY